MKLIKPSYAILEQGPGIEGVYKAIEEAGRTCYQSSHKIADGTAKEFVDKMIKSGHGAMLEHGTVYLKCNNTMSGNTYILFSKYFNNKYSISKCIENREDISNRGISFTEYFITTNFRVLVENDWLDDLQYICEPTEHHEKRIGVRFICDRGVSHKQFVA